MGSYLCGLVVGWLWLGFWPQWIHADFIISACGLLYSLRWDVLFEDFSPTTVGSEIGTIFHFHQHNNYDRRNLVFLVVWLSHLKPPKSVFKIFLWSIARPYWHNFIIPLVMSKNLCISCGLIIFLFMWLVKLPLMSM